MDQEKMIYFTEEDGSRTGFYVLEETKINGKRQKMQGRPAKKEKRIMDTREFEVFLIFRTPFFQCLVPSTPPPAFHFFTQ